MESKYLKQLSVVLKSYKYLLIYGAGGVAEDLLILLEPYLCKEKVCIVVSDERENRRILKGYLVKNILEFCDIRDEVYIILSTAPRYTDQIKKNLNHLGFQHYCTASQLTEQIYQEIWEQPVKRNKILFANGDAYGFGGNPKYIALELMKRSRDLDLVWVTGREDAGLPEGVRAVSYGTYEHYYELGTARIWIDNQHKNFYTRKRDGQFYIQTWHGGGPLKKIEFDAEGLPEAYLDLCEMNSGMEDVMVSPSGFNSGLYRRAFHYQGEIMECGYPRNDLFWKNNGCRKKMEELFGINPEDGILLFAPTYRNFASEEKDILDLSWIQKALERSTGKRYRILVRFHPFDKAPQKGCYKEWIDVTAYEDVQELLAASDILITDYSSIMWDFSLQGKTVFLFHPDLERYEKERGYYLSFADMPYIEAFSNEELVEKIEQFRLGEYQKALSDFLSDYGTFDKGIASRAIADRILEYTEE